MAIDVKILYEEKEQLTKEFNELKTQINKVEIDLGQMKSNLNAIHGALQQTQRLINLASEDKKSKITKVRRGNKVMKKFKSFIEETEKDLLDFEEDVLGEAPPNTADAMKRYKAGKAGFTDKAHLKAKGLIARSDGTKHKSDKYK